MAGAKEGKKQGGKEDHAHAAPAVKGVEHTHSGFFVFGWTRLDDGTDEDLDEAAANGVDSYRDQDACKRIRADFRQSDQTDKSHDDAAVRQQNTGPVADAVDKPGRQ